MDGNFNVTQYLLKLMKNSLVQNTGIYTITSIINSAIPFFLLPIMTRYLTPEDYGLVSMFLLLVSIISPFIGMNVSGAIARRYYEGKSTDIWSYVFNCITLLALGTIFVSIFLGIFSVQIAKITHFPLEYLWIVIIFSLSQAIVSIILALWQVQKMPLYHGVFSILNTLTNLILSIVFVVFLDFGWQGRIFGQFSAIVIFALLALLILLRNKWIELKFSKQDIKHALAFGLPLIPHSLSGIIISMTDRFFITSMVGLASTGIYTIGYQVGSIINLFASSFNNAYVPWLYERLKKDKYDTKLRIVKFTYLYFIMIIVAAVGLGLLAPMFLNFFIGKAFYESSIYVIWVALGYAFQGMYYMVVNYIFYAQQNSLLAGVTIFSALLNIILNYFFIKNFGAVGAAQATTIVFAVKFVMVWFLSAKVYKMPWKQVLVEKHE